MTLDIGHIMKPLRCSGLSSPLKLFGWGILAAIFVVIQELLQLSFECPCSGQYNIPYGVLFFVLPGFTFAMLSHLVWPCGKWFLCVVRACFLALMWGAVVCLDGVAVACLMTESCLLMNNTDIVCKVIDQTATPEERICFRYLIFASRTFGLFLLAAMVFFPWIYYKCCFRCHEAKDVPETYALLGDDNSTTSQYGTLSTQVHRVPSGEDTGRDFGSNTASSNNGPGPPHVG